MREAPADGALEAPGSLRCEHSLVAPVCVVVDWLAASIIAIAIVAGVQFHN